tara:strand:- start:1603 stop:2520 length:918 start_codon:yes stop_codon:yes gene_type:complete
MLAIIIPYFKLTFFEATLQSLANQTDKRFKVYIGDDASPENPNDLLSRYKGQFDYVYHRFENNLGGTSLTQQWDRCIALSGNEEWIMILGDDDVLVENVVEVFYDKYAEFNDKTNLIRFASKQINEKTKIDSEIFTHPRWEKSSDFYIKKQKGLVRSSLSECVFLRMVYSKYGFRNYPLAWHSDDLAWIEFADSKLVYAINEAVVEFRMSFENISGKNTNLKEKAIAELCFKRDLLSEKLHFFTNIQKLSLLMSFEYCLKNNREVLFKEWLLLLKYYINIGHVIPFFKCIRRMVVYYSKSLILNC